MTGQELTTAFNRLAGKIVRFGEYCDREKELLRRKLSRREKLFRALVDTPHQLLSTLAHLPRLIRDTAEDAVYQDEKTRALYMDAWEMALFEQRVAGEGLNRTFQNKLLKIRLAALEACADHRRRVQNKELKRLPRR